MRIDGETINFKHYGFKQVLCHAADEPSECKCNINNTVSVQLL